MNAPDRYERFVVPEGTKKVSYERDTKIINAASFTVEREDHTIGNILRMQLHRDDNVLFAGYKLPHPLKYKIIVRIHTTSQSSPMQAYNQAINDLDKELDHLKNAFELCYVILFGMLLLRNDLALALLISIKVLSEKPNDQSIIDWVGRESTFDTSGESEVRLLSISSLLFKNKTEEKYLVVVMALLIAYPKAGVE
ncbi:hypothetical protein POTOM_032961 [Populus tomentosa]|uniref:DNA-directed RNA polymerase RBP11-like dimerisation domain-containing protein n=2 Tax=Populus TaxID=3689 RepID=A0A8X7Z4N9_POPTO|nr:hypothetical protein POTOM_032961 [Populus tomentosa]